MKSLLLKGALGLIGAASLHAAVWTLSGDLNSHDPSLWRENGTWWIGRTWGAGIGIAYSSDGHAWTGGTPIWGNGLSWWHAYNGDTAWTWAPSLVDYQGRAICFYALSTFGSQTSAIGLATATTIAQGDWTDQGAIITSQPGANFNAIDPCFVTDAAYSPWLSYGSFWGGIFLTALDPATLHPMGTVTNLASNSAGIEGSQIVYHAGYYYLFASVGSCCDGAASTYHIVYGRASAITGPYYDQNNVALTAGGGTTLDSGGGRYIAPGGESIYNNAGAWVLARHELDSQNAYSTVLFINDLYWDANGWPTYTLPAPQITGQPLAVTAAAGASAAFSCPAAYGATYQWSKNDVAISGATGPTLELSSVGTADAGTYACTVSNATGSATSSGAALTVTTTAAPALLVNLSCRGQVGTGADVLIGGFYLGGQGASGDESILIRASGPALNAFGVTGTLPDPDLNLVEVPSQTAVGGNVGWGGSAAIAQAAASVGAFGWPDASSADSALLENLPPGGYSAVVTGTNGDTGVALLEMYDAVPAASRTATTPQPVNLSARVAVGAGATAAVGLSLSGTAARTVLIRASGPALTGFNVSGAIPDTQLQLWNLTGGQRVLLLSTAGWSGDATVAAAANSVGAFGWPSDGSADTAVLVSLAPGQYSAEVGGLSDEPGIALLEVYEVP